MSRFAKQRESQKVQPKVLSTRVVEVEQAYLSLHRTQRGLVGMLIACAMLGFTVFRVPQGGPGSRAFLPIILSTSLLTFAFTIRNSAVLPALADLRRNPRDPQPLRRWKRNTLVVLSLCAAVGLTGFALQLLGAATPVALTLYAIAVAYLFLLRPIRP